VSRLIALIFVLLVLAGCRAPQPTPAASSDVRISLVVLPDPPATGESTLQVTVTNASGDPISGAQVSARGDMSHAGMVPVIAESVSSDAGVYAIPFEWTMAGDWFVDVTVTLADGTEVQQRFDLSVTGGGMHNMTMPEATEAAHG
jgi:hypothetical protein